MLFNKEKRLKYFGFNDIWFVSIGVFVLGFVTDYLFTNSFARYEFGIAVASWSISFCFSITNWLIMRVNIIYLRKKFPELKDVTKRILLLLLLIVLTVVFVDVIGNMIVISIKGGNYHLEKRYRILLPIILISVMVMAIYEAIYFYVRLQKSIREEEQAKQIVVMAQLDALRNQAQPHFFFNSLNTLRDIIDQNSKEDAKQFVDKLSDVYRFILDSGDANLIALRNELKFVKAYIHIQSERFGDNLKLNWNIPDSELDRMIVPMSLQLLLENAIKHNVVSRSKPLIINVEIQGEYLVVNNKIQPKSTQLPSTKVGLKNIEKRHALISDKLPKIENDGTEFTVSIPLLTPIGLKE